MTITINVIVTCTKQKTVDPPPSLQLRNVAGDTMEDRVRQWKHHLDDADCRSTTPGSLYAGDHWAVAKSILHCAKASERILVWVISAGYGLLALDAEIHPYSATFSTRHPDTVVLPRSSSQIDPASDKRDWWNSLIELDWRRDNPISITDLATHYPDSPLLIAASANYLSAVQDDLRAAHELLSEPRSLAIMSAGTDDLGELTENLIPSDARLQPLVGGALRSLNVRLLRYALEATRNSAPTLTTLKRRFQKLLDVAPDRPKYDRSSVSDEELRHFMHKALCEDSRMTQTKLLRNLRDSGKACEQGRFRTLFKEIQRAHNG